MVQDNWQQYHPIKIILPTNYPIAPPRVYFDKQLTMDIIQSLSYMGQQNMIWIPYLQHWNAQTCNLVMMMNQLLPVIAANPPVPRNQQQQFYQQQPPP